METPVIVCPLCGQEYHPVEIYLPNEFFGKPTEIVKTTSGKVDFVLGTDMDLNECYSCDNCGVTFKVTAKLSFTTESVKLTEEHVTRFTKLRKFVLDEPISTSESLFADD